MPVVNSHVDSTWTAWASGHVSGTDGGGATAPRNMTGTLDESSNFPNFVVSYPSGSIDPIIPGCVAPSGSVLLQMPLGLVHGGPRADYLLQTGYWNVTMIPGSGTDRKSNGLATIQNYRLVPVAHCSPSGSYLFAFQRLSGSAVASAGFTLDSDPSFTSASFQYEVPQDLVNPGNMACGWKFFAIGRKTSRQR